MATTNLITKTLGCVLTQSGNGVPDHTSPAGSLYSDKDSGLVYQNSDGATLWFALQGVAYGEGLYNDVIAATTIVTQNIWAPVVNNFTGATDTIGISANTSSSLLVVMSGYDGKYEVRGDVTLSFVAGTNDYEVGISLNSDDPITGTYMGCFIDTTYNRQHVGFQTIIDLVGGDTLNIDVRNITNTDNIIVRHAQLFVRKVG